MTVLFLLQPDALWPLPAPYSDLQKEKNTHLRFLDFWKRYGVIYLSNNQQEMSQAIESLPQEVRKIWQEAMRMPQFRKVHKDFEYQNIDFYDESHCANVSADINLVCLEKDTAIRMFPDEHWPKFIGSNKLEVCRYDCVDGSNIVGRQVSMWDKQILTGSKMEDIWNSRFLGLCAFSKNISIIDRYCGKSIVDCYMSGKLSGVLKFISKICNIKGDIQGKSINVFTSDNSFDADRIAMPLKKQIDVNRKNINSLTLYVVKDKDFSRVAHDRFITFDRIVTSIGKGMSLFEKPVCEENFSCSMQYDDGDFKNKIEKFLREKVQGRRIL